MKFFEKLNNLLAGFERERGYQSDSYERYKEYEKDGEWYEDDIFDLVQDLVNEADGEVHKFTYTYVGSFDSPGYSLSCYCMVILDENNEIHTYPMNFEHF